MTLAHSHCIGVWPVQSSRALVSAGSCADLMLCCDHLKILFLKKDFIYLVSEKGEGRQKERERTMDV